MVFVRGLSVVVGLLIVGSVLISALKTVVLPRVGFTRIAQAVFGSMHRLMIHPWGGDAWRRNRQDLFAPVSLVTLPLVWMVAETIGFAFLFWGFNVGSVDRAIEVSGSSLFTLGFAEPASNGQIWLTFVEATIGLGLVALLISYLPTIYGAYNQREKGINTLAPFAGTPASVPTLLARLHRANLLSAPTLWNSSSNWLLDLEQSHTSFPALCYFPTQSPTQSWVADAGTLLDSAALLVSSYGPGHPDAVGPVLVLAYGIPSLARIGRAAGLPLDPPVYFEDLLGPAAEPPTISISADEYHAVLGGLVAAGVLPAPETDGWATFANIRSGYDRSLRALAGLTGATAAPWSTDRPATVGRPRMIIRRRVAVDWSTDAIASH